MFALVGRKTTTTTTARRVTVACVSDAFAAGPSSYASLARTFASSSLASQAAPAGTSTGGNASSSQSSSSSPRDRLRRFGQSGGSSGPRGPGGSAGSSAQGGGGAGGARGPRVGGGGGGAPGGARDNRRRGQGARPGRSRRGPTSILPFEQWIKGPIAARYKETPTTKGPHWIGDTPFPLNTSFRPPAPIHAKVKDELWRLHASDPAKHTVRSLSAQFSIGIPRVEAILRLKALELEFQQKGHPLQTEFQSNMDRLLGSELRPNLNPEQDPVPERQHHSPRGQIFEESAETSASADESGSVLAPALAAVEAEQAAAVRALPNRGIDPNAISPPRTIGSNPPKLTVNPGTGPASKSTTATSSSPVKKRAVLTVVNVSGRSYEGDGRIARNQKRAVKRSKVKAKQRDTRAVTAAAQALAAEQKTASKAARAARSS